MNGGMGGYGMNGMGMGGGMGGMGVASSYGARGGGGMGRSGGTGSAFPAGAGQSSGSSSYKRHDDQAVEGKVFLGGLDTNTPKQVVLDYVTQW